MGHVAVCTCGLRRQPGRRAKVALPQGLVSPRHEPASHPLTVTKVSNEECDRYILLSESGVSSTVSVEDAATCMVTIQVSGQQCGCHPVVTQLRHSCDGSCIRYRTLSRAGRKQRHSHMGVTAETVSAVLATVTPTSDVHNCALIVRPTQTL